MFIPIDRRDFLRHAAALGVALPFARSAAAAEADLVARKVFFDNPDVGSVRVSPDGQNLAWLAPIDGVRNLFVAPRDDLAAARAVTHATDRNLSPFYRWAHTNRHLVFFQERDGDENWRASSVDLGSGAIVPLTPERGVKAYWQEADRKFPDEMLFKHNARDKRYFDLFRVNVVTGKSELLFENNEFAWYVTDSDFQLRLGVRFVADGSAEWLERRPDGSWAPFMNGADRRHRLDPAASTSAPTARRSTCSTRAAATRRRCSRSTWRPGTTPCSRPTTRPTSCRSTSTSFNAGRSPRAPTGTASAGMRSIRPRRRISPTLRGYGPGDVEIIDRSADNRFATVFYERDTESGEYRAARSRRREKCAACSGSARRSPTWRLRKMQPVIIPARDGLRLNGYLTLPEAGSSRLPMVLVIHGGPYARDSLGLQFRPPMAGQPRLCGAQRQLSRLDRIRQSLRHRGRQGMGRQDA